MSMGNIYIYVILLLLLYIHIMWTIKYLSQYNTMPMKLDDGWNQIQFNMSDFTRFAYGTNYTETLRVQIHACCRIRRVYFSDRLYSENELPEEFKLYIPVQNQKAKQ